MNCCHNPPIFQNNYTTFQKKYITKRRLRAMDTRILMLISFCHRTLSALYRIFFHYQLFGCSQGKEINFRGKGAKRGL
jgi:hypothetical protein